MISKTKEPKLIVTVNSTGRQAASFIRVASAVGWRVRAQVRQQDARGTTAEELSSLPNVLLMIGELDDPSLVGRLFRGADLAFVNTTHWGNEMEIGRALADAAKEAGVQHYVYSSMPDHSTFAQGWKALPLWKVKADLEKYIRTLDMPSTFVYAGIYNNNFTTLPYPLFRMELQDDGSFIWRAPFHPDDPLPWLDAEHDVGPALLQVFKEGPDVWKNHRIPLTFEVLTPLQVCASFARALNRSVRYVHAPIDFKVSLPKGYHEHLVILGEVLGKQRAPYYGPTMYYPHEAIRLWEGNRSMEEYASEAFLVEERANGQTWMGIDEDEESVADTESVVGTPYSGVGMGTTPADEPPTPSRRYVAPWGTEHPPDSPGGMPLSPPATP